MANVSDQPADETALRNMIESIMTGPELESVVQKTLAARTKEEIQPNPTVIIKNLPYDTDMEMLEETLRGIGGGNILFKSFFPHTDSSGNFLGLVFINYRNVQDAQKAFSELSTLEIGGRKTRVEYRRLKPGEKLPKEETPKPTRPAKPKRSIEDNWRLQRRPPPAEEQPPKHPKELKVEQYLEQVKQYTEELQEFVDRDDELGMDFEYPPTLSSFHRRAVHEAAESLKLGHRSNESEDGKRFIQVTKDQDKRLVWKEEEEREQLLSKKTKKDYKLEDEDENGQKFVDGLRAFKEQPESEGLDYNFPPFLHPVERRRIHRIAEALELGHRVCEDEEGQKFMCCTKDLEKIEQWKELDAELREKRKSGGAAEPKTPTSDSETPRKGRRRGGRRANGEEGAPTRSYEMKPLPPEELAKIKWTVPRSQRKDEDNGQGFGGGTIKRYIPTRQPKGPPEEGSKGFFVRTEYMALQQQKSVSVE